MSTGITKEGLETLLTLMDEKVEKANVSMQDEIDSRITKSIAASEEKYAADIKALEDLITEREDLITERDTRISAQQDLINAANDIYRELLGSINELRTGFAGDLEGLGTELNEIKEHLEESVVSIREKQSLAVTQSEEAIETWHNHLNDTEVELRMNIEQVRNEIKDFKSVIDDERIARNESFENILNQIKANDISDEIAGLINDRDKNLKETIDALQLLFMGELKKHDAYIQKARSDDYARVMELLNEFRKTINVRDIVEWSDGTSYDIGTTVRSANGLWSNLRTTSEKPEFGCSDWVCLSTSIDRIEVADQHPNGVRATINVFDSLGKSIPVSFDLPTVHRLAGSWVEDAEYRQLDSVMSDGLRWIAGCDNPKGKPGDSADWIIESMRGPQGKRGLKGIPGPRGEPGPVSKVMTEDVMAYLKAIEPEGGQKVQRYMGHWVSGTEYIAGDIVKYNEGLWLAKRDHKYSSPPDRNIDAWEYIGGAK